MKTYYVKGPRLHREPDLRNFSLRAHWWVKFQAGVDYIDERIGGAVIDAVYRQKVRLARHKLNKIQMEKQRKEAAGNVVPISIARRLADG